MPTVVHALLRFYHTSSVVMHLQEPAASTVSAVQTKLQERDDALAQRQSQILELHTELSQLQRLLKLGPSGSAAAAGLRSSSLRMSGGMQQPGSPGTAAGGWGGGGCGYDERGSHAAAAAMLGCCSYSPGRGGSGGNRAGLRSRGSAEDVVAAATDGECLIRVCEEAAAAACKTLLRLGHNSCWRVTLLYDLQRG
jgi:hypothetical protein